MNTLNLSAGEILDNLWSICTVASLLGMALQWPQWARWGLWGISVGVLISLFIVEWKSQPDTPLDWTTAYMEEMER